MPRFFCPTPLQTGATLVLPATVARHVQVLRLQPGSQVHLFNNGPGWPGEATDGEFAATITHMGRTEVQAQIGDLFAIQREAPRQVHLAVGMPANERMDWLVEKAVELGVTSIQPLMTERSVLRLSDQRAEKKIAHWQAIAIAACEQCGGNRVPTVHPVQYVLPWLKQWQQSQPSAPRAVNALLLSLREGTAPVRSWLKDSNPVLFLSGPEGGLSKVEEDAAIAAGFQAASLGPRILRAETAALSALAQLI